MPGALGRAEVGSPCPLACILPHSVEEVLSSDWGQRREPSFMGPRSVGAQEHGEPSFMGARSVGAQLHGAQVWVCGH